MDDYEYHLFEEVRARRLSRRGFLRRASVLGLGLPAASAILSACGQGGGINSVPAVGPPRRGGTANVAITRPASLVDPVTLYNQGGQTTAQIAGEYLCFPRADYTLDPRLAVSWSAKRPDTWTFVLRQGVKWHDGKPFTADDVVYTMNLLTDPKVNSSALSAFKGIFSHGNIEKVDDHTVTFHLDQPFVDFPYLVSAFNFNAIILPKNYQIGDFAKGRVGTGAFVMTGYQPETGATFARNPDYWDKRYPYLDNLRLTYYADDSTIALNMQGGRENVWPIAPHQSAQALQETPNLKIIKSPSSEYRGFHMRTDQAPFDNPLVRQAVAACFDRPALVQALLGGDGELGNDHSFAPVFPVSKQAIAQIPQRKQDYALAKSLLARAGHPNGFPVTLTTEQYLEIPQYAVLAQQALKPAGINLQLNVQQQSAYYGTGNSQPWLEVPMGIVDWGARGVPSQAILPAYTSGGIWNAAHWKDPGFDRAFADLNASLDEQTRLKAAARMAAIQHDQVPAIIGYWIKNLRVTGVSIGGLAEGPANHFDPRTLWSAV
ncbi:ABC transporter substrate-binding protein [Amycolatopsis carbonis]|uniref:ABC transporter substrate-binding protein n=1 Tax=Amycolatopsis carbonis TaxID=715471 RepID=A0A9Y2IDB8_9PSEU|nr:ABC transporter substrate-binding protein [Amycolatopsis sp. 2-15]WIX77992.1 ABC transporter substrate-binding protein [Amycolatopsis sp. 2-15]